MGVNICKYQPSVSARYTAGVQTSAEVIIRFIYNIEEMQIVHKLYLIGTFLNKVTGSASQKRTKTADKNINEVQRMK